MLVQTVVGPIEVISHRRKIIFGGSLYATGCVTSFTPWMSRKLTIKEFTNIPWNQLKPSSLVEYPNTQLIMEFADPGHDGVSLSPLMPNVTTIYFWPHAAPPHVTRAISQWSKYVQARTEKCSLAICMATHTRLGASSPANALDKDILALICKLL